MVKVKAAEVNKVPLDKETIIHDLFVVGVTAASMFVKNPKSQEKAANIVTLLQGLLGHL